MSFPKRFYCISDTHLYPGCRWRGDVLRFLWGADAPVYWLGDTLEGYRSNSSLGDMANGDEIDRELAVYIETACVEGRLVRGNHDNELFLIKNQPDALRDHQQSIAITHGHNWDAFFSTPQVEAQADAIGRLIHRLEQIGVRIASKLLRGVRDRGWVKRAEAWMSDRSIKTLICGHTHDPDVWVTDKGTIGVCGAWKDGAPYSVILVEDGVPREVKWTTWANDPDPTPDPEPPPVPDPEQPADPRDAIDIRLVTWNASEAEVKTWPVKATMTLCLPDRKSDTVAVAYDAGVRWKNISDKEKVNANVHLIIEKDGRYYGGTWEWLRNETVTTTWNRKLEVPFDEIGRQCQFGPLEKHKMQKGDKCWMMISGVCRGGKRNVRERTQIVEVTWP